VKAARLFGPGDVRVLDEAPPEPRDGEALVRVTSVGICGSDLHWFEESAIGDARLTRPLVLGHEAAGVIASGPRAGERVAIDPNLPCQACPTCRRGLGHLCPSVRFLGHSDMDENSRALALKRAKAVELALVESGARSDAISIASDREAKDRGAVISLEP